MSAQGGDVLDDECADQAVGPARLAPDIPDDELFLVRKSLLEKRLGRADDPDPIAHSFLVAFCRMRTPSEVNGLGHMIIEAIAYGEAYKGSSDFWVDFLMLVNDTIVSYAKK